MDAKAFELLAKMPNLYTERLMLRKIETSDVFDMYEYSKNPSVTEYLLWFPHYDIKVTKQYLKYLQTMYNRNSYYDWGVVLRQTGKMIGTCGFSHFDKENMSGEIGYVLNPDYWGQGIAAECAKRVIRFGFDNLGLHRVTVRILEGNTQSIKVAEKLGMRYESTHVRALYTKGQFKTYYEYALLKDECKF